MTSAQDHVLPIIGYRVWQWDLRVAVTQWWAMAIRQAAGGQMHGL